MYIKNKTMPEADAETTGLAKWAANKFYVDEFYDRIVVRPLTILSDVLFVVIDKLVIDLLVMATAWIVGFTGRTIRLVQTGNTGVYIFAMVIGMMVLMFIQLVY